MPRVVSRSSQLAATIAALAVPLALVAQQPPARPLTPREDSTRTAQRLDAAGQHAPARAILQAQVDNAPDAAARASAQRRFAMSYGYDANCAKVVELEEQVIAYWATRRATDPQNGFFNEGEVANEAARVCIDAGALDEAERMYRRGYELGNMEPAPRTHPKSLWDFRLAHALGRLAARRGNAAEAGRQVTEARRILDSDSAMARQQERYFPYLAGYVALYTNDLGTAERELTRSVGLLPNDPMQVVLLAMTYEKLGQQAKATELYERAFSMSGGSNPPAIYARRVTREKLGRN